MKTILLNFAFQQGGNLPPMKYRVIDRTKTTMLVESTDKRWSHEPMKLTLQANGNWKNQNFCEFVEVKADRRPKPFTVKAREFGRGKPSVHKFATLAELQKYVRDRWQGVEYMDGPTGFHSDYCTFEIEGATLNDLGDRHPEDQWTWVWKELV